MENDVLEELSFTLAAYDTANVHAMRLWYAASLISVTILMSEAGLGNLNVIFEGGFKIVEAMPAALLALAVLNFVFVVAQISHYRMAEAWFLMVKSKVSKVELMPGRSEVTWSDLAFRAPIAGHNRIAPLIETFWMNPDSNVGRSLKFIFDCAFGFIPALGLAAGLYRLSRETPFYMLITIIGSISIIASLGIAKHAYLWATKMSDW